MSEFANRIDSQRNILNTVNATNWPSEPLMSLSKKAIIRFSIANNLSNDCDLVLNLLRAANNLFFLANKSQEQITEDYKDISKKVDGIHHNIKACLSKNY